MSILGWIVGERMNSNYSKTYTNCENAAETIAQGISAENKHIENRFQWNLGLQGFLFASFAISITAKEESKLAISFADVVADTGTASAIVTFVGLIMAYWSIDSYKSQWITNSAQLDVVAARPFSSPLPSFLGRLPSTLITLLIVWAWWRLDQIIPG